MPLRCFESTNGIDMRPPPAIGRHSAARASLTTPRRPTSLLKPAAAKLGHELRATSRTHRPFNRDL